MATLFNPAGDPEIPTRYNISPIQQIACIRDGELTFMRWGLIPSWAKDEKSAYTTFNARGETVAEKPTFRAAFKKRRCLIPASGFYEWQTVGKAKLPYHVHLKDDALFAFAGLWEQWTPPKGEAVRPPIAQTRSQSGTCS